MTSVASAIASTGTIPPISVSELNAPAPPGPKTPPSGDMMAQYAKDQEKIESARSERDKAAGDMPKFPELTPEPKPDTSNDPVKGYVSAIGVLGAIGSMFSRVPLTHVMNAATGTLNSMNASDQAAYKRNFDAWKVQNENALKLLDYQNNVYKNIMESKNKSVDERIAELQAHAAMFKDDYMMQLAQDRHLETIDNHLEKVQALGEKAKEASEKMVEGQEKQDLWKEWQQEHPTATAEEKAAGRSRIFDPSVEAATVRAEAAEKKEATKDNQSYSEAVDLIDKAISQAEAGGGLGVTGLAGVAERGKETIQTLTPLGKSVATPANDFAATIDTLRTELPKKLTGTSRSAADERAQIATIVGGLGMGQTKDITVNKLNELREIFQKRLDQGGTTPAIHGTAHQIGDVIAHPNGQKYIITRIREDGVPMGVPINKPLEPASEEK